MAAPRNDRDLALEEESEGDGGGGRGRIANFGGGRLDNIQRIHQRRKLWEAMTEAPRNDSDLARQVKQRMDNIKRIEKLKRDFSSAPPAAAASASHSPPATSGASQRYRDARRSGVLTSPKLYADFHNVKLPALRLQHPDTPHNRLMQMIGQVLLMCC